MCVCVCVCVYTHRYDLQEGQVRQAVRSALELVNLGDTLQRPTHTLSGGQRQRVAIAGKHKARPIANVYRIVNQYTRA